MHDLDTIELCAGFSADTREALLNSEGRIGRSRRKFEEVETPVSFIDEIGKSPARVDADAYGFVSVC